MNAIFFVIMMADGMFIGMLVRKITDVMFGDSVISKLLSMILGFASGIGYFLMCGYFLFGDANISIGLGLFILLAPLVVLLILKAFQASEEAKNSDDNNKST